MNFAEFCKLVKFDEDEFFALPFDKACAVVREHGFEITGLGIAPIKGTTPKVLRS